MAHGKIEENTVNSGIFNGWGDKGIGSIVEHDVFDRFYGDKSVKYRALKETIAKTWKHILKTSFVTTKPAEIAHVLVHASCMQLFFAQTECFSLE